MLRGQILVDRHAWTASSGWHTVPERNAHQGHAPCDVGLRAAWMVSTFEARARVFSDALFPIAMGLIPRSLLRLGKYPEV